MSKKLIKMNTRKEKLFSEVWKEFITSQTAKGVSDTTLNNYHQVLHNISKYFDIETPNGEEKRLEYYPLKYKAENFHKLSAFLLSVISKIPDTYRVAH